jgi:CHASE3 domain sensor protein
MTRRLWRGLAAFVLLLVGAGLLIFSGVRHQDATIDSVVQPLQPLQIINLQIRSDFASSQAVLRGYLITRQPRFLALYRASRNHLQAALARAYGLTGGGWRRDIAAQRRSRPSGSATPGACRGSPPAAPPWPG